MKPKEDSPSVIKTRYFKTYAEMLLRLREEMLQQMAEKRNNRRGMASRDSTPFVSAVYSVYTSNRRNEFNAG